MFGYIWSVLEYLGLSAKSESEVIVMQDTIIPFGDDEIENIKDSNTNTNLEQNNNVNINIDIKEESNTKYKSEINTIKNRNWGDLLKKLKSENHCFTVNNNSNFQAYPEYTTKKIHNNSSIKQPYSGKGKMKQNKLKLKQN